MEPDMSHIEIKRLLEKTAEIAEENNQILKKIHRNAVVGVWIRVIWYVALIGLPFALYFYILEPYFTALGSSYEIFSAGMQEIPGFKQFSETLDSYRQ